MQSAFNARSNPEESMLSKTLAPAVYLVATDGSACGARAVEVASTLVAALGGAAELHIVHVLDPTPASSIMSTGPLATPTDLLANGRVVLDAACVEAAARFSGKIAGHLAAGGPWREIVQMASSLRADLAIVGTAGRTGIARLALGSVAEQVVRHAGCPVLVVRPKDHQMQADAGIEPPCGDCVKVQNETARVQLWCERHAAHHPRGRTHYEFPPTFALGSMNFRPSP
jgi:nucleotide-binding universal stress UspA family protein